MEVMPSHPLRQISAIYVPKLPLVTPRKVVVLKKSLRALCNETVLFGCDAVFSHLIPDGHAGDAQNFRGLRLIAAGLFQRFDQPAFFCVVSGSHGTDGGW
jgi:hypothetical protein